MPRYDARRIEAHWQAYWEANQTFTTTADPAKPKLYVLDMFPYPSGEGLHVGHPEGYTATDIVTRFERMRGKNVLHPMGWDSFGLPAEEHAIKTGTHPQVTTYKNIDNFRRQLKMLGFSYDWSREIATTDPLYYRWTQWIFLQLFDTWFDPDCKWTGPDGVTRTGRGRPIAELPIPAEVKGAGEIAVRRYQDSQRLAYQHEAPVNWCPALGTVLANEEVIDGKSERGSHPVVRLPLRQWMLRITCYADRLLGELESVDWPDSVKALQRNWIGRSEGAEVDFLLASSASPTFEAWQGTRQSSGFPTNPESGVLRVYTTRPDTLFGATYMVLSPEHSAVNMVTSAEQQGAVDAYRKQAALKSDLDRTDLAKDKTGVFTGGYALNPVNGQQVPIWIADYVLASYGTGAIMAVPAHDERDFEFAQKFNLPIIPVVAPLDAAIDPLGFTGEGKAINSGEYNGTETAVLKPRITSDLAASGLGKNAVNYRLRDWLFSRQRYWGEPFPLWHELDGEGEPTGLMRTVPESELPVVLPEIADYQPTGTPEPLLSKAPDSWLYATAADGTRLKRETNSMPQWAGSCWYYLRFADPTNTTRFIGEEAENYWLPVDLYIGGAEHAVLHLLYSRFWHKVLFDRGYVRTSEPFGKLVNQGMILGEMEFTLGQLIAGGEAAPSKVAADDVTKQGDKFVLKSNPAVAVEARSYKMSKSRGNVINPDRVVQQYGADSLRMYEMFMGPLEATKPWSMAGVDGVFRFLGRVWRMIADEKADEIQLNPQVQDVAATPEQLRVLHKTIKSVTEDIEKLSLNTAISRMMEFTNEFINLEVKPRVLMEPFVLLLAPYAPHLAEELWSLLGHTTSLAYHPWPVFDPALIVEATMEVPVQIGGKLRGKVTVPTGADQKAIEAAVMADASLASHFAGKAIVKTIYVAGKMLNYVVR